MFGFYSSPRPTNHAFIHTYLTYGIQLIPNESEISLIRYTNEIYTYNYGCCIHIKRYTFKIIKKN